MEGREVDEGGREVDEGGTGKERREEKVLGERGGWMRGRGGALGGGRGDH